MCFGTLVEVREQVFRSQISSSSLPEAGYPFKEVSVIPQAAYPRLAGPQAPSRGITKLISKINHHKLRTEYHILYFKSSKGIMALDIFQSEKTHKSK